MFRQTKFNDSGLEIYELSDGVTSARFAPGRGGLLIGYNVKGVPFFYLNKSTLVDLNKNVRGGNPVLFPICGPLRDNIYTLPDGRQFSMKQHGLARNLPWQVEDVKCSEGNAQFVMKLESNEETLAAFPFKFRLIFNYFIEKGKITINQIYENESTEEMPFYAGFHPYFYNPAGGKLTLHIPAQSCFNIKSGQNQKFTGQIDFASVAETNLVFENLQEQQVFFDRADGHRVTVKFNDVFNYIVLWNLRGQEFLCLEPWMGNNFDMNEGKALRLNPGEKLRTQVEYMFT